MKVISSLLFGADQRYVYLWAVAALLAIIALLAAISRRGEPLASIRCGRCATNKQIRPNSKVKSKVPLANLSLEAELLFWRKCRSRTLDVDFGHWT